jgi:hypothetical protein
MVLQQRSACLAVTCQRHLDRLARTLLIGMIGSSLQSTVLCIRDPSQTGRRQLALLYSWLASEVKDELLAQELVFVRIINFCNVRRTSSKTCSFCRSF